jgi:hypothetical protein
MDRRNAPPPRTKAREKARGKIRPDSRSLARDPNCHCRWAKLGKHPPWPEECGGVIVTVQSLGSYLARMRRKETARQTNRTFRKRSLTIPRPEVPSPFP